MNPELHNEESMEVTKEKHPVFQVTTISKYLALALFVVLPFLGGYIGYVYAPEKVVERVVVQEKNIEEATNLEISQWDTYVNTDYNFSFQYPKDWIKDLNIDLSDSYEYVVSFTNPQTPSVPRSDSSIDIISVVIPKKPCVGGDMSTNALGQIEHRGGSWSELSLASAKYVCIEDQSSIFKFNVRSSDPNIQKILDQVIDSVSWEE